MKWRPLPLPSSASTFPSTTYSYERAFRASGNSAAQRHDAAGTGVSTISRFVHCSARPAVKAPPWLADGNIVSTSAGSGSLTINDFARAPLRFVARQPILTTAEQVFGYELLFRDGIENGFNNSDPDSAARSTLDSSILAGLNTICAGYYAFINRTRDVSVNN